MHPVIRKTFGGLSVQYYIRNFLFGLVIAALNIYMLTLAEQSQAIGIWFFILISTLLYPYSRFVYESIVEYIMGGTVFFVNAIFMLVTKVITMLMCFAMAVFIAPIGLLYLYYHHSKAER